MSIQSKINIDIDSLISKISNEKLKIKGLKDENEIKISNFKIQELEKILNRLVEEHISMFVVFDIIYK